MSLSNISEIDSNHACKIMKRMLVEKDFTDVILIAADDGRRIDAHRNILSMASDLFATMFAESQRQDKEKMISITEMSGDVLCTLVDSCYTGKIQLIPENVEEILRAASLLRFDVIIGKCFDYMAELLDLSNCIRFYIVADQQNSIKFTVRAFRFISEHYKIVSESSEFLKLNRSQLFIFLCNDYLAVDTEEDVFRSLIAWIDGDKVNRSQDIFYLLPLVRLSLMEPEFLQTNVKIECEKYNCMELYNTIITETSATPRKLATKCCLLLAFGQDPKKKTTKKQPPEAILMSYHPMLNKWRRIEGITINRINFGATIWHDKLIIVGGSTLRNEPVKTVEFWDLKTKTCHPMNDLNKPRYLHKVVVANGILYAIGGRHTRYRDTGAMERLIDLNGKWEMVAFVPGTCYKDRCLSIAVHNERIYSPANSRFNFQLYYYEANKNRWEFITEKFTESNHGYKEEYSIVSVKNLMYLIGECFIGTYRSIDGKTSQWTFSDFDGDVVNFRTSIGDLIYTIDTPEYDSTSKFYVRQFDPVKGEWKNLPHLLITDCFQVITMPT